ncbi:hypothetical protein [Endozoicomonas sp.]|uniref:hypothetical protein n=1 Tax=Endozoicomonas sp. TaxID=1892382 RepID=UPI003AF99844
MKQASLALVLSTVVACSFVDTQEHPKKDASFIYPDTLQEKPGFTNMATYGQFMGCQAGKRNRGGPQDGWVKSPSLPGSYEDYLSGWEAGFRKCRKEQGPEENPGGPIVPPGDLYP